MKIVLVSLIVGLFAFSSQFAMSQQGLPGQQPAPETGEKFKLGMAGYSFLNFDIDKTLEIMNKVNVHYLCIKDFHLPLNSTDDQIKAFCKKLKDKGVTGYAVGPIYMISESAVDSAFEYAKKVGVNMIIGVPNYELLPYVDKKVKQYNFKFAIHIHGPSLLLFPDADDVWNRVKDLDKRIGMCLDIGHDTRNGKDPVLDLKKYHDRIFDMHIKDVTSNTGQGYSLEIGRGIINYPSFVKMLREVGYSGVCSLEYERDMDNPFMGIAESIGYFRGIVMATK